MRRPSSVVRNCILLNCETVEHEVEVMLAKRRKAYDNEKAWSDFCQTLIGRPQYRQAAAVRDSYLTACLDIEDERLEVLRRRVSLYRIGVGLGFKGLESKLRRAEEECGRVEVEYEPPGTSYEIYY